MAIWFEQPSWEVTPGRALGLGFMISNDSEHSVTFEVRVEVPDGRFRHQWLEIDVPGPVAPRGTGAGAVWVQVPQGSLGAGGEYVVRLIAVDPRTRRRSIAECVVYVAADRAAARLPCVAFPTAPSFALKGGGVDATVTVVNCGPATLTVKLRFRHERGWLFAVEREVVLGVDAGPVDVSVRLDQPAGQTLRPRDRITVEADWQGTLLDTAEAEMGLPAVTSRPRLRRAAVVAASLAVLALAGLPTLLGDGVLGDADGGPPVPEIEADPVGPDADADGTESEEDTTDAGEETSGADESNGPDEANGPDESNGPDETGETDPPEVDLPDLVVTDLGHISVTVENRGPGDAGPFSVAVNGTFLQEGPEIIEFAEGLAAGESDSGGWGFCASGQLHAEVDPDGVVEESDGSNNTLAVSLPSCID